ncbi:MAG: tryptophan 7-halogenase [Candidatus Sphingomonas phytovorans]|nr:tryptophan halogenase family protein [Sphingomonas sp.]WEK00806.1 MAG: tryptophan 7-halogenase [Sphingomonas sp.]
MQDDRYHIVIVGGGTAGWMTAAGLVRQLPGADYAITLVESDEIGTVGVGEATLPHIKLFNDMLGLDEARFMRETQATFKLGIEFRDWDRHGDRYIHPFGAFGEPWGGVEFQNHWLRANANGRAVAPLQAYSYAVAAACANAFELPDEDPKSIRSTYSYAYHFDAGLYAAFLRRWATARGVTRIEGQVETIDRNETSDAISGVTLKSGQYIQGDLFVDCTGFRSLLLAGQFDVGWEDWTQWLPCDRALAVPCVHGGNFTPYTRSTARPAGWQWRIPLQHRIGNGYIFSSNFLSQEEARETLLANLDGAALAEPRLLRFSPGRRALSWHSNCVAIGLASGFLEPLESTSIYLIQAAVIDLINLMPTPRAVRDGIDPRLADEFNRLTVMQYERVRDFLVLHYIANRREGEPLWDYLRHMPVPDSLTHKLELFRARAMAPNYQYGLFARDSWLSVLIGQGIMPAGYDRLADTFDLDMAVARLDDFAGRIESSVAAMSSHADFIANYCAAEGVPA